MVRLNEQTETHLIVKNINMMNYNWLVTSMEGGNPTIIIKVEGQQMTPLVGVYSKNDDHLRKIVKPRTMVNPDNAFLWVKIFIGINMSEVSKDSRYASSSLVCDDNDNVKLVKLDFLSIGK